MSTAVYNTVLTGVFENGATPRSKAKYSNKVFVYAGQTLRIPILVVDSSGRPFAIPDNTRGVLTVRDQFGRTVFTPRYVDFSLLPQLGQGFVQLIPNDTISAGIESYKFDVWLFLPDDNGLASNNNPVPILTDYFTILPSVHFSSDVPGQQTTLAPVAGLPGVITEVLTEGDSITAEGVTSTQALGGYQALFQHECNIHGKAIRFKGPTVITGPTFIDGIPFADGVNKRAGTSGAKIDTGAGNIAANYPSYVTTYVPGLGKLLILMAGTNNLQKTGGLNDTGAVCAGRLSTLTDTIMAANADLTLIVVTVPPQGKNFSPPLYANYIAAQETADCNTAVKAFVATKAAQGKRILCAPVYDRFVNYVGPQGEDWSGGVVVNGVYTALPGVGLSQPYSPGLLCDGLHLTMTGYQIMAQEVFGVAQSFISDRV